MVIRSKNTVATSKHTVTTSKHIVITRRDPWFSQFINGDIDKTVAIESIKVNMIVYNINIYKDGQNRDYTHLHA